MNIKANLTRASTWVAIAASIFALWSSIKNFLWAIRSDDFQQIALDFTFSSPMTNLFEIDLLLLAFTEPFLLVGILAVTLFAKKSLTRVALPALFAMGAILFFGLASTVYGSPTEAFAWAFGSPPESDFYKFAVLMAVVSIVLEYALKPKGGKVVEAGKRALADNQPVAFDTATGQPIYGYDTNTGAPIY